MISTHHRGFWGLFSVLYLPTIQKLKALCDRLGKPHIRFSVFLPMEVHAEGWFDPGQTGELLMEWFYEHVEFLQHGTMYTRVSEFIRVMLFMRRILPLLACIFLFERRGNCQAPCVEISPA